MTVQYRLLSAHIVWENTAAKLLFQILNMNINLLLNGAENETGVPVSAGRSLKDEPIPAPLPLRPYISYQTQNLRCGLCTIHPISPPQRHKFSSQEDALMQYMIDNIQSGRVKILSICLKRSLHAINTRWDVLDSYEPCPICIQCQQFQKGIERLRRKYVLVSSHCTIHLLILIKLPKVRLDNYALFPEYKDLCGNSSTAFYWARSETSPAYHCPIIRPGL